MIREAERRQEAADLAALEKQATAKGGLGVLGTADTAMALSKGQVQTLLMLQSFGGAGGGSAATSFRSRRTTRR